MYKYVFLCLWLSIFINCNNPKLKKDDSISKSEGIAPHEAAIENAALDASDQAVLASAKGKTMDAISAKSLLEKWNHKGQQSQLFYFWQIDNEGVLNQLKTLHDLENEKEGQQIELIIVNMDNGDRKEKINAVLRASGLVTERYFMKDQLDYNAIDYTWSGETPMLFLNNRSQDLSQKFAQGLDLEELKAILGAYLSSAID